MTTMLTEPTTEQTIRVIPISKIKIGDRHRKDLGDLEALAASLKGGLLQPIGVTPRYELIWDSGGIDSLGSQLSNLAPFPERSQVLRSHSDLWGFPTIKQNDLLKSRQAVA